MAGVMAAASAQVTPIKTLSFQDAVKIGLQNNFALQQQRNQLTNTQVNKTSALFQMGPRIEANGNIFRNEGNSFNQQQGEVVNGVIDFMNGSVNASIPIFNGLRQINSYRQAQSQNEAQLHQVMRSSQDVIQSVSNQYLTCLLDRQLIKINEKNIEAQKLQYDQIQAQVELGARAEADLYNQEYQWKNAELLLIRAQIRLKNDLALLAQSLAIDATIPLQLEAVDWSIDALLQDSVALSEMYNTALNRRSDLKQAEYNEKAAHYGYSALKGLYYPSVFGGASYGSRYNYIHGFQNRSFSDQFTQDNTQLSYGVSITVPIFYGFANRARAVQARTLYKNAQIEKAATEVTIKTEVLRVYQNFNDAKNSLLASESQLRAAKLSYETQKERYDLGVSNVVELNTTNQLYVQAQGDYQSALFTLMFQRVLIDYAIGTLSFEDIP